MGKSDGIPQSASWPGILELAYVFFLSAKMLCNDLSEDFFHQNMMVQWCHASPRSSGRGQERIVRNENPILGFKFRRTASSDWSGANPLAFAQGRTFHNIYILYIYIQT